MEGAETGARVRELRERVDEMDRILDERALSVEALIGLRGSLRPFAEAMGREVV